MKFYCRKCQLGQPFLPSCLGLKAGSRSLPVVKYLAGGEYWSCSGRGGGDL